MSRNGHQRNIAEVDTTLKQPNQWRRSSLSPPLVILSFGDLEGHHLDIPSKGSTKLYENASKTHSPPPPSRLLIKHVGTVLNHSTHHPSISRTSRGGEIPLVVIQKEKERQKAKKAKFPVLQFPFVGFYQFFCKSSLHRNRKRKYGMYNAGSTTSPFHSPCSCIALHCIALHRMHPSPSPSSFPFLSFPFLSIWSFRSSLVAANPPLPQKQR